MAKPDPVLLDPSRYPFSCDIETRFTDLDLNQHINNVALVDILQEGRARFNFKSGFATAISGMTTMAVSLSVEFLGQGQYRQPITSHAGAISVGRTSHKLGQLLVQGSEIVAYAETVLVCVRDNKPAENPAAFHESIKEWMFRP